jgi:hypothetical protein
MPWQELAIRTGISLVAFTVTAWLYVHALRFVGRHLKGAGKVAVSLGIYVLVAAAMTGALGFVFGSANDVATRQSASYIAAVLICWVVVACPGLVYLRSHFRELRALGFFLSR